MKISFIIPCYRSENTLMDVCDELIKKVQERPEYDYEIVLINDCSPDNVYLVMQNLAVMYERVKVIDLAKNVGKHAALMAGFRYSVGDVVVCLDDDGQCPMDCLWSLLEPIEGDADVSIAQYGVKKQSKFKNFGSWMNAWMMTTMLEKPKDLQFANFLAIKKFVIKEMLKYENSYTYINGLILRTTQNIVNVPMEERERAKGTGGYTFRKSLKLWINGATAFSVMPLRFATCMGLVCIGIGAVFSLVLLVGCLAKIIGNCWPFLTLATIFFVGGLLMVMLGLLGEYVGRIYISINNSPQYVIRRMINVTEIE